MCQSPSSFFRQEIEIGGVICGVIVAVKCQRKGSLRGLFCVKEYQYAPLELYRASHDKSKVPFCQSCHRQTDKDLIIILHD